MIMRCLQEGHSSIKAVGTNWGLLIPPLSLGSFGKQTALEREREVVGAPSPCSLSKFCCPAQSDKEATGTASSVSSLINLLIRLIQQCFSGGKPAPSGKSCSTRGLYTVFSPFFFPSGSLCIFYDYLYSEVKGVCLHQMPHLTLKCLK